ncbi:MAG: hypothetical protein WBC92_11825 [Terracidiphilus sp.]
MKKLCYLAAASMLFAFALPTLGETYKNTYPDSCDVLWGAVKTALSVKDNYNVKKTDDAHMNADYAPKHQVHFDVSGVLLQRENHVRLAPKGPGCEMQVVSNYSGWGHDDQSDFKKRVDQALAKQKGAKTSTPDQPATPAVPETPVQPAAPDKPAASASQSN